MPQTQKIKRHAALFDGAASRIGVDLQEAAIRGALRFEEISEAVVRCTGCPKPDDCAVWLAQEGGPADGLPAYCRNIPLLDRLKNGLAG